LPEYFALLGEEKEEKRELLEETILADELKKFLEEVRPEIRQKKEAMKESQKAMHPEKKKLPPMPEEKAF